MKNILITGGSGLVGKRLTKELESANYQVAWMSRSPEKQEQKSFGWDINQGTMDDEALQWSDAIIHLAGAGVAEKKWTSQRKKIILESRTKTAQLLFDRLRVLENKPEIIVSASGANYYGLDNGEEWLNEESPAGNDFLSEVVVKWEKSVKQFESLGLRTACLRTGIVLAKDGGALPQMLQPPIAAPLGTGSQYMSWIHLEDLARMFIFALEQNNITGSYNAVAPNPVTNRELTKKAAKVKGKPYVDIPVPGFFLKLILGEMAGMVLGGNKVSGDKIIEDGFKFHFSEIDHALEEVFRREK
ncbi:TIGR01777 family oxidoreductase [Echinicola sediminis]